MTLLVITIAVALAFDFTNGFHDTANAIATSVSTRALSPRMAVVISSVLNLAGAVVTVVFFQAKVSNTIGQIVAFKAGLVVIISALVGAITWNLFTWYLGLPSSSTHALVGALSGAAIAVITLALVATGHLSTFKVPIWVVLLSASAIAFGTYAGGWRIIRTLGWRIYKLDPATGFAAQLTGAAVIQFATQFGLPVSTTHVVTGSVMGAGASQRLSALRWGVGANIVLAWVLTIPAAGLMAWVVYAILNTAGLRG